MLYKLYDKESSSMCCFLAYLTVHTSGDKEGLDSGAQGDVSSTTAATATSTTRDHDSSWD
ncbi:hypothetical protein DPMN_152400 [Dreissena polymorpha]|uniref:Uncharacterized protein n=1 Tax=Dreissena polymorpha TaxID=45954 RepID=A0A9D4FMY5_DREPO|nr:hypothetical protein DPMN_152400 [Dreissena polymorpha]